MAISLSGGDKQTNSTYQSSESMTQSTATSFQALSLKTDISVLGMGTATGFARNIYSLASGAVEGQEKMIISNATGEAKVFVLGPTTGRLPIQIAFENNPTATGGLDALLASATGLWTFQSDGDYLLLKYLNGTWTYLAGVGATLATST